MKSHLFASFKVVVAATVSSASLDGEPIAYLKSPGIPHPVKNY